MDAAFWSGKVVFLTGHTGFKGAWLSIWLERMGAKVHGFSLPPPTQPSLYEVAKLESRLASSTFGDVRDLKALSAAFDASGAEIAIHMAAQPIVRDSYIDPVGTYATNVMGTVNYLEATRQGRKPRASVVVTTDKCYENREWVWAYRENEAMGGFDPYSSSKGCAELAVSAYRRSFVDSSERIGLATARAGNVIGGGDWANHRLLPDFFRAIEAGQTLSIRYPKSVRPWQHVLVPLSGYISLCEALWRDPETFSDGWNFGPDTERDHTVEDILKLLATVWTDPVQWEIERGPHPHEAAQLRLDSSKARQFLNWTPAWSTRDGVIAAALWQQAFRNGEEPYGVTARQIEAYMAGAAPQVWPSRISA